MRHAFDLHNTLGRFADERIYQEEMAIRCESSGFSVNKEVLVRVSHNGFSKTYDLDLVLENGTIYEFKTVETLNTRHQRQLIHYLLLTNQNHGKLINFRPTSVQSRFVSTTLDHHERHQTEWNTSQYQVRTTKDHDLVERFKSLMKDWGTFLEASLYEEALAHLPHGANSAPTPVNIEIKKRIVGTQNMHLLDDATAWHISAITRYSNSYETHLFRLLQNSNIERMHWINLNHKTISLKTLQRGGASL